MNNLKNYENKKNSSKKNFKLVGSIIGIAISSIAISSCSQSKNNTENVDNTTTEIIPDNIISTTTEDLEKTIVTIIPETEASSEITTTEITTTEATIVTTTEKTTVTTTEAPVVTTTEKTTVTTTEPIVTTTEKTTVTTTEPVVTTTEKTTVTTTQPVVTTTEIEDEPISEEVFTSKNINDYNFFVEKLDQLCFNTFSPSGYNVYYNINNNKYEFTRVTGDDEKYLFVAILNLDYMEQDTLYKLFGEYSKDELKGLCYNIASVFGKDLSRTKFYDYSDIIVDKKLGNLLNEMTKYYKAGNTTKLEQLCNSNLGKYNDLVDIMLLGYICNENIITDRGPGEIAYDMAENMNLYNTIHSKSLTR